MTVFLHRLCNIAIIISAVLASPCMLRDGAGATRMLIRSSQDTGGGAGYRQLPASGHVHSQYVRWEFSHQPHFRPEDDQSIQSKRRQSFRFSNWLRSIFLYNNFCSVKAVPVHFKHVVVNYSNPASYAYKSLRNNESIIQFLQLRSFFELCKKQISVLLDYCRASQREATGNDTV